MEVLHDHDIEDVALRASCYHPKAPVKAIQDAAHQLRGLFSNHLFDWRIYTTERARKPNALMLRSVGASCYYGDSDEDAQAAKEAGIPFVRVERFR
jgi:acid phosphatase class B